jgi:hypothetical protein
MFETTNQVCTWEVIVLCCSNMFPLRRTTVSLAAFDERA